jgi:UDP-N-acetylmuramate--alanine ligase
LLDEVYLCDIYPAREEPIPGVSSKLIYDNLREGIAKHLISKDEIMQSVRTGVYDVLITLGAGDIENYSNQIATELLGRAD